MLPPSALHCLSHCQPPLTCRPRLQPDHQIISLSPPQHPALDQDLDPTRTRLSPSLRSYMARRKPLPSLRCQPLLQWQTQLTSLPLQWQTQLTSLELQQCPRLQLDRLSPSHQQDQVILPTRLPLAESARDCNNSGIERVRRTSSVPIAFAATARPMLPHGGLWVLRIACDATARPMLPHGGLRRLNNVPIAYDAPNRPQRPHVRLRMLNNVPIAYDATARPQRPHVRLRFLRRVGNAWTISRR